jgi:hypothetical protein
VPKKIGGTQAGAAAEAGEVFLVSAGLLGGNLRKRDLLASLISSGVSA